MRKGSVFQTPVMINRLAQTRAQAQARAQTLTLTSFHHNTSLKSIFYNDCETGALQGKSNGHILRGYGQDF